MWLLNTESLTLKEFMTDPPPYVILSHTWGKEEVTFKDIHESYSRNMIGFPKIKHCCEYAFKSGFDWVWIDTCCINKESSAELSEAINSMYTWYWQAEICYAYLVDVSAEEDRTSLSSQLGESKWFTRGWTLQELLAPRIVEFYDTNWGFVGTKCSLASTIEKATKIAIEHLVNRESIRDATVGTRFRWASLRSTTRLEDGAYCLMGLFDVNMPLLYGEGSRAFYRLQLEILKHSSDHTIFAWDPWPGDIFEQMGLLAPSPRQFVNTANVRRATIPHRLARAESIYNTIDITNRGLRISRPRQDLGIRRYVVLINCRLGNKYLGLELERDPNQPENYRSDRLVRVNGSKVTGKNHRDASDTTWHSCFLQAESRLRVRIPKQPAGSMRMTVSNVHFKTWELQHLAVRSRTASPFQIHAHRSCSAAHSLVVAEDTVVLSFLVQDISFAAAICHDQQRIRFGLVKPAPANDAVAYGIALQQLQRDGGLSVNLDFVSFKVDSGIEVNLSARKGKCRMTDKIFWTVLVEILKSETEESHAPQCLAPDLTQTRAVTSAVVPRVSLWKLPWVALSNIIGSHG